MSLQQTNPLTYTVYCSQVSHFIEWASCHVHNSNIHGHKGWLYHFENIPAGRSKKSELPNWMKGLAIAKSETPRGWYSKPTWKQLLRAKAELHDSLIKSLDNEDRLLVDNINRIIVDWGGLPPLKDESGRLPEYIRVVLNLLKSESDNAWPNIDQFAKYLTPTRIAALTKIFHIFEPHKWIIYDSRVAAAICSLVDMYWKQSSNPGNKSLLLFSCPEGRNKLWERPAGFPGCSGGLRDSLSFIYVSWISRKIADILRQDPGKYGTPPSDPKSQIKMPSVRLYEGWKLCHIETVLWSIGIAPFGLNLPLKTLSQSCRGL